MSDPQESAHLSAWDTKRYIPKVGEPDLPPQLSDLVNKSPEDVVVELNRLPFFMTKMDDSDGNGGDNIQLEALKSLAYEGEPHEVAENFKNQGNDCFKVKRYKTAVEYYTKGLDMDCNDDTINKALYLNRAACNLEMKNYRSCIEDCKKVLLIDPKNVKACFRSGKAFMLVKRYPEAIEILKYGLVVDPENTDMKSLIEKVTAAANEETRMAALREAKAERSRMVQLILVNAVKLRHYTIVKTSRPPELIQDTKMKLENEQDHESQLIFPAMVIYPTADEFDFVAEVSELTTPAELLAMVLDRPSEWFKDPKHHDFTLKNLECYMETATGGLVKVGKKVDFHSILSTEKPIIPLFDDSLRIYSVPKLQAPQWLASWNREAALAKRVV